MEFIGTLQKSWFWRVKVDPKPCRPMPCARYSRTPDQAYPPSWRVRPANVEGESGNSYESLGFRV